MAPSSGSRPARRRAGRQLHQPEECAISLFHQNGDTTKSNLCSDYSADANRLVRDGLERISPPLVYRPRRTAGREEFVKAPEGGEGD
jgi:hypothetical protein